MPSTPSSKRRPLVGICFYDGWLGVAPSILNALTILDESGFDTEVLVGSSDIDYAPLPALPKSVRIRECRHWSATFSKIEGKIKSLFSRSSPGPAAAQQPEKSSRIRAYYSYARSSFLMALDVTQFSLFAMWRAMRGRYCAAIGVDAVGLQAATTAMMLRRGPVVYWSLELQFRDRLKSFMQRFFKRVECWCHRRAEMVVVPDSDRAAALVAENRADSSTVRIVPNGPLGPSATVKGRFFHEKFGLDANTKVLLHIGAISPLMCSLELAAAASSWPEDWVLVFHERALRPMDSYLTQIQEAGRGRVRLSLEPVAYDRLDELVSSAELGFVLYRNDHGPNLALMAGASGKTGHYLRCGVPILAVDCPCMVPIIQQYQCGLSVDKMESIAPAAVKVLGEYAAFQANARKCYEEHYEFGRHFRKVVGEISRLCGIDEAGNR